MAPAETKQPSDGIVNSAGAGWIGVGPMFVAMVPVTSWATKPGGLIEQAINGTLKSMAYVGTAGSSSSITPTRVIPALGALYITVAFALTGSASVAGCSMGNKSGLDNNRKLGLSIPVARALPSTSID
ncbi:MAG: hypothetical protein M1828_002422 [Chrysothrix sp. TS-e1954]|nr:MAG: hypothetical protein M1828_002422 [Chrysothrix sp. TS-e1954]